MSQTHWLPGVLVLVAGIAAAALFLWFKRRGALAPSSAPPGGVPPRTEELEVRYQALIAQLKSLEADKHHLAADQYSAERARLERSAAEILRHKAQAAQAAKAEAERAHEALKAEARRERMEKQPRRTGLTITLWLVGGTALFAGLGVLLSQESTARVDDGPMTGGGAPGTAGAAAQGGAAAQADPELEGLLSRAQANPDDVEGLSRLTRALLLRQRLADAVPLIERATGLDPFHVETRVHRALLRAARGSPQEARAELFHLGKTYPGAHQALLYGGALAEESGDLATALNAFPRFLVEAPEWERPPMLAQHIANLRAQVGGSAVDAGAQSR